MANLLVPQLRVLLHTPEPPTLGPGPRAHIESAATVNGRLDDLARERQLPHLQHELVRALALLWHDHSHAAHAIVQEIETADGSLIHAILHRREPDYWNAKYWFRRAGRHPAYPAVAEAVNELLPKQAQAELARCLTPGGIWDPLAFVDACQAVAASPDTDPRAQVLRAVQQVEFEALLNRLWQAAP